MTPMTLYDKLWDSHHVVDLADGSSLVYIDLQLLHEVTSPQGFSNLRRAGRAPWRRSSAVAMPDHNVPTMGRDQGLAGFTDPLARLQVETLEKNCAEFNVPMFQLDDLRQGIVHIVGPEQGLTLPGMTVACGDSHTTTHGALATLGYGVGSSEVERVLATQTLRCRKLKNMAVEVNGKFAPGIGVKDLALHVIGLVGTAGGSGHAMEFCGTAIEALSMEARMTLCNMSVEAGARIGLIGYDAVTEAYVHGRPYAPVGEMWERAKAYWAGLHSDPGAQYERRVVIAAGDVPPCVTWGTSPEMVISIDGRVPLLESARDETQRDGWRRALTYMGLQEGQPIAGTPVDKVFIGSCTNSRIEDLRLAADLVRGHHVHSRIKQALVVPGSGLVKLQAEREGLDEVFLAAGFEWREPGCSMCLGMNPDRLKPGERCASTSNRNFEGRQGRGGRTHLMSPAMAVATAITGALADVREI